MKTRRLFQDFSENPYLSPEYIADLKKKNEDSREFWNAMNGNEQTEKTEVFLRDIAAVCERHGLTFGTLTGEELIVEDLTEGKSQGSLHALLLTRDESFAASKERGPKKSG